MSARIPDVHAHAVFAAMIEAFLPSSCACCPAPLPGHCRGLCPACEAALAALSGHRCPRCGRPADEVLETCLHCRDEPPAQDGTVVWGSYEGRLREVLLALKHRRRDDLAATLGDRLAGRIALAPWADSVDVVTWVPSHLLHRLQRGAVASELVAQRVARRLGTPVRPLLKRRGMVRQAGRTLAQRRTLGGGRFAIRRTSSFADHTVLMIDDVMTTGTTLRRASATLRTAGAGAVYAACVAWTPESRRIT
jgi:predicted amidophosphoribosyltransferase